MLVRSARTWPMKRRCLSALHALFLFCTLCISLQASALPSRERRVFAHYLPWYTSSDGWTYLNSTTGEYVRQCVSQPLIGDYSQLNSSVLEYHVLTAIVSGVDGFVVNWDPRSSLQTSIISKLFEVVAALPAAFELDPTKDVQAGGDARNHLASSSVVKPRLLVSYDYQGTDYDPSLLRSHFSQLRDLWVQQHSPQYFRDDGAGGAPVVVLWNGAATEAYSAAAREVFENNVTLLTINADFRNVNFSTGAFEWVQPQLRKSFDPSDWGQAYLSDFEWRMAHQVDYGGVPRAHAQELMMGNVYPGFNDSRVPFYWNQGNARWLPREVDGVRVMNLTWEQQLQYKPAADPALVQVDMPWVQVVTWNDWPEGTTVEPAAAGSIAASGTGNASGYTDLLQCRRGSFAFKGLSDGGSPQRTTGDDGTELSIVQIPLWILEARSAGYNDLANASVALLARGLYENASVVARSWHCAGFQSGCEASCNTCDHLNNWLSADEESHCGRWQCLDGAPSTTTVEYWSVLAAATGVAVLLLR